MKIRLVIFLSVLLLSAVHEAGAQSYRDAIPAPPVEIYQSMLNFVERKEYPKVLGSLNVLAPIVSHITSKFSDNPTDGIKKAVEKGSPDEILLSVQTLIVLDMKDLMDEAMKQVEQSPAASKTMIKTARINYELLSSYVQKKEFAIDQKIKKDFQELFRLLGSESVYSADQGKIKGDQLRRISVEIVYGISKVFVLKAS